MKQHFKPTTAELRFNAAVRRLPFYTQGAAHLYDTKHSKAWGDYGYPVTLNFWFYYSMYRRVGLARAVIKRMNDMCWLSHPMIKVNEDAPEDEAFKKFAQRLSLWQKLRQLDDMQSVGHYAGLIVRVADGLELNQPMDKTSLDRIVDVMPAWEGQLIPVSLEQDRRSMRYGLPIEYTYQQTGVKKDSQRDGTDQFTIHWTRVIIWNEGAVGNTIYGESRIEPCYNALMDWEKVRGAGAEGFWKKAAMRAVLEAAGDTAGQGPSDDDLDELTEVITEMQNNFDQVPYLGGMTLKTLGESGAISGIDKASQIALEDVSAGCGWSAKGLVGAQEGVLAGEQDSSLDKQTAQSRRENYLSMEISKFITWLGTYCSDFDGDKVVEWDDLMSPSDKSRLELAEKMTNINKGMMETVYTSEEIREITGYDPLPEVEEFEAPEGDGEGRDDEEIEMVSQS